jgi:hypothetical protein
MSLPPQKFTLPPSCWYYWWQENETCKGELLQVVSCSCQVPLKPPNDSEVIRGWQTHRHDIINHPSLYNKKSKLKSRCLKDEINTSLCQSDENWRSESVTAPMISNSLDSPAMLYSTNWRHSQWHRQEHNHNMTCKACAHHQSENGNAKWHYIS